jgi:virginiamycin B lyase
MRGRNAGVRRVARFLAVGVGLAAHVVGAPPPAHAVTFTEFPIPTVASQPLGIAPGPDGALWFVESAKSKIGRITTAGTVTEFNIPTASSGAFTIAPGPDGALWFTERNANKIGRITTAGVVTEYPVPTANSSPAGIVAGPDGSPNKAATKSGASRPPA